MAHGLLVLCDNKQQVKVPENQAIISLSDQICLIINGMAGVRNKLRTIHLMPWRCEMRSIVVQNSLVWTAAILASAVVLKGTEQFLPMLLIFLMGAVASDALLARSRGKANTDAVSKAAS